MTDVATEIASALLRRCTRNDTRSAGAYTPLVPYYVYILSNTAGTVLYTGVTNNLIRRTQEHREHLVAGFTAKYNVTRLVYYEQTTEVSSAIEREKQIKAGSRKKKISLIKAMNPTWDDLYDSIVG